MVSLAGKYERTAPSEISCQQGYGSPVLLESNTFSSLRDLYRPRQRMLGRLGNDRSRERLLRGFLRTRIAVLGLGW